MRVFVGACVAALMWAGLVVPVGAQSQSHAVCVPTGSTPVIKTGKPTLEGQNVGFQLTARFSSASVADVTVRVTIRFDDGTSYSTSLLISSSSRMGTTTRSTLSVDAAGRKSVALTVDDDSAYRWCTRHAVQEGPYRSPRWSPPPPQDWTPQDPPDYVQEIIDNAPPRPEPRPFPGDDVTGERRHAALYGPGGPLEPSYRLEWLCWGTFGTADGC